MITQSEPNPVGTKDSGEVPATRVVGEITDLSKEELKTILELCRSGDLGKPLAGKGVAMIFEKPSNRTRNSTEMAVVQLGGHPVYIRGEEIGMGVRETVEDVAHTLGCYHDIICARVFKHDVITRMAATGAAPVVNLLSDRSHPLQAIADILTLQQEYGTDLTGRTIAYVGDANNVTRSLFLAAHHMGMRMHLATPQGYGFDSDDVETLAAAGVVYELCPTPIEAIEGADCVYTDVWTSMGQEDQAEQRHKDFVGWTIDSALMDTAADGAIFMHCLPAHPGQECTREVLDAADSRIWRQAKNRMYAARGVFTWLQHLKEGKTYD